METYSDKEIINLPRKRGRPRKNKTTEKPTKEKIVKDKKITAKDNENREIILHLPFVGRKTNSSPDSEKNAFTMGEDSVTDAPDGTKNDSDNDATKEAPDPVDDAILTISDQESVNSNEQDDTLHMGELINELKKRNKVIKALRDEISTLKELVSDGAFVTCREIKTIPMNVSFVDIKNDKTIICEKTDIACWWCTYNFDTLPCFIPERFADGKFYVFGCFCSFDCAKAYNLSLNDYKVSNRNSLMRKLYNTIKGTDEDIPIAPARELLEKFGGHISIDEYRKISRSINKEYRLLLPPMVNLVACIEEKTKDKHIGKTPIPEIKRSFVDEKNIIPVKKKILHDSKSFNILDTIGIKEKKKGFFE
jgi:hypothetical protein